MGYVGRFAPSPTGPLHIGSLVAAVASYLQARQSGGEWLVRIEDLDPPREVAGAATAILRALERFGLFWDREVLYQSTRTSAYRSAIERLLHAGLAYRCSCTRSELRNLGHGQSTPERYPGTCRNRQYHSRETAIRLRAPDEPVHFEDVLQGGQSYPIESTTGDYVIFRRDGLPSYHLAVVLDDAEQGVTQVIRGVDLLDVTALHIHLQRALALPTPGYGHVPVIVNAAGQKLSKQTGATAIELPRADAIAFALLPYLGLDPPVELRGASPSELWEWAIPRWKPQRLAGRLQLCERS
jgi:glutamyl-Q tRNA(Asp) synthetase